MVCGVCRHGVWGVQTQCVGCADTVCGVCRHGVWGVLTRCVECADTVCGVCVVDALLAQSLIALRASRNPS